MSAVAPARPAAATAAALEADLVAVLGRARVFADAPLRAAYGADRTECPPGDPVLVVQACTTEEVAEVLRVAGRHRTPVVPRVTGNNVGGLTIPHEGAIVLDLASMDRILDVDEDDMYALIEPGVSWQQLKDHLEARGHGLRLGFPLAPPETSVAAGCLMDGLGSLTLAHGPMGQWINGLEVVLPSGEIVRTGAAALSDSWFSRAPLPDLTGLFLNWFGATGVVTKLAIQLWPRPALRRRVFVLGHDLGALFAVMRRLGRTGQMDDVGAIGWPAGKMLFGVERPAVDPAPGEPVAYLFADLSAGGAAELALKGAVLEEALAEARRAGARLDGPIEMDTLVRLDPRFAKFADYPTRLDFLLDHRGGGLSWVGTYGPQARLERAAERAVAILRAHGFPPLLVSRPMRGGHFAVLRFIVTFDRTDDGEAQNVRACNRALVEALVDEGFVPYKMPGWAARQLREKFDPGFVALMERIKKLLDPQGLMNPGTWWW
ncbi:MAG TPA: FAD-binding oxidoreductase [Myxococcota bacterium]|jgi:glycolate oxidase|nr:FAD-binding oxidoreductase [Myxococcota bacterium]